MKINSLFLIVFLLLFGGCSDALSAKSDKQMKVGYFVSVFDKEVSYSCAGERKALASDGEFECQSFPIAFYADSVKLGEINTIHQDGYVFPQDIIVLEEPNHPIYSSDEQMLELSYLQE